MAKFLSPDSRSDWKLEGTGDKETDSAVSSPHRPLWSFHPSMINKTFSTHVALLKPTYSFPASLFMKFMTCRAADNKYVLVDLSIAP